jgi:transposase
MTITQDDPRIKPVAQRVEIFTGAGRRRSWTAEEKAQIVAEAEGASVSPVARAHGLTPSQIFRWRRTIARSRPAPVPSLNFAPVVVEDKTAPTAAEVIEIELKGAINCAFPLERVRRRSWRGEGAAFCPMMLPHRPVQVLMATRPVDFRKGMDGLAALVQEYLKDDPFSGTMFVFRAKRADRIKLVLVPAHFQVIVTRRPKYACRSCEGAVVQVPATSRLIEGGLPTEGLVAHVLVAKYADHCPLYRQAQIYARQGITLDRSTLAHWVGRAAWLLTPIHARLLEMLKSSPKLFADETTAPVLDPGRGRTKKARFGPSHVMIDRGVDPIRRPWSIPTPQVAALNTPPRY